MTSTPESGPREHKQPFRGRHLASLLVTGPGSSKHTRHHEIAIDGAPVTYLPGDALGVYPTNDIHLVERVLRALGAAGDEVVPSTTGASTTLVETLTNERSLGAASRRLIELLAAHGAADLAPLLEKANTEAFKHYATGHEAHDVLDVLEAYPSIRLDPAAFVDTLRTSLPRLYSIASSQRACPDQVHVLVISLQFSLRGRERLGVGSTWINDRWDVGASAEMYLQNQQSHFAMPADDRPMIMVGPGTGIAPFRAFLQERRASGARGRNWLFFGEQHRATEFYYEAELTEWARDGWLRLDTAFSRDQPEKIYVQHRMREQAADLFAWLEEGGELFVCGDKSRMAADVDRELHAIIETTGGRTPEQAREYVAALKKSKRYKRDVY